MSRNTRAADLVSLLVAALAAFGVVVRIAHQRRPLPVYRVGLVAPFEGLYHDTGYSALAVARARIRLWNSRLAARGFQVQVWAVDDSNDPTLAVLRAEELANDPFVLVTVGHMTPETSTAASPIYSRAKLLQVSPVPLGSQPDTSKGYSSLSTAPSPADIAAAWQERPTTAVVGTSLWHAEVWPDGLYADLRRTTSPPDSIAVNAPILELTRQMVESERAPSRVVLPYGYCPRALLQLFPSVSFETISAFKQPTGTAEQAVGQAIDLALRLMFEAGRDRQPNRATILESARALVTAQDWRLYNATWYPPAPSAARIPCALVPN